MAVGSWQALGQLSPPQPPPLLLLAVAALALLSAAQAIPQAPESDLTFSLAPGHRECFYQPVKPGTVVEIEYQVIDGGELDVDFTVTAPSGTVLLAEHRQGDGVHSVDVKEEGDYEICFDNSFSHISEKLIFFEILLDHMQPEEERPEWMDAISADHLIGMKLEDLQESLNSVKARLSRSHQIQTVLRAFEARDRNLQESNLARVNLWSAASVLALMGVSALQVYLVRSLFEDKRRVHT